MRIAPTSNNQNNKQSFKAHVSVLENAKVVFNNDYGFDFRNHFKALIQPLVTSEVRGIAYVSASRYTKRGIMFDIESNLRRGSKSLFQHDYISVPNNLGSLEKAMKLASGVFKPFIRAGKRLK